MLALAGYFALSLASIFYSVNHLHQRGSCTWNTIDPPRGLITFQWEFLPRVLVTISAQGFFIFRIYKCKCYFCGIKRTNSVSVSRNNWTFVVCFVFVALAEMGGPFHIEIVDSQCSVYLTAISIGECDE